MKRNDHPLLVGVMILYFSFTSAQRAVIANTRAVAGTQHTLTCTLENFDSSSITLLYTWSIASQRISTCTSEQCVIPDIQLTYARTDYRCEVRRHDDNTVIAISDDTSLEVSIPQTLLQFQEITIMQDLYVGSNVTYRCFFSYFNIRNIAADISISGPGIDQNSDHVFLGEVIQVPDGFGNIEFKRRLEFNPISSSDAGSYLCNVTVTSAEPNPLVMSRMEETTQNIQVFRPTINISLDPVYPVADHYLNIAPYNYFSFNCSVVITVLDTPLNLNRVFSWQRTIEGSSSNISAEFFTGSQSSSSGSSVLSMNATEAGIHTYTCTITLDVSPAPDIITNSSSLHITITGPSNPAVPIGLSANFSTNVTLVMWLIPLITYDPETHVVQYGLSVSNMNLNSSLVLINSSIRSTNLIGRVELTDLMVNTIYFYRVIARNSAGITSSAIASFTTGSVGTSERIIYISIGSTAAAVLVILIGVAALSTIMWKSLVKRKTQSPTNITSHNLTENQAYGVMPNKLNDDINVVYEEIM